MAFRVVLGGFGFWCGWSSSVASTIGTCSCSGVGGLVLVGGDFVFEVLPGPGWGVVFLGFLLLSAVEFLCFRFFEVEVAVVTDDAVVRDVAVFTFVIGVSCVWHCVFSFAIITAVWVIT